MSQSDPEREPLPLHSASEDTICTTNGVICSGKKAGTNGVGVSRNPRRAALEAGQCVLLDRQRVQSRTNPVRLLLPLLITVKLLSEVRLPEGDVAGASDPVDHNNPGALLPEGIDPVSILCDHLTGGKKSLILRDCQLLQGIVEDFRQGALKRPRIIWRQGVPVTVTPLIHGKPRHMIRGRFSAP